MRINMVLILFSLLFIFIFFKLTAAPASAIDTSQVSAGSGESLADKLIDASNGKGLATGDTRFAPTPKKSRQLWNNSSKVDFTMPKTLSDSGMSAKESRNDAESTAAVQDQSANTAGADTTQTDTSQTNTTQTPETTQAETQSSTTAGTVSGSWSFELSDSTIKNTVLTLFQSGDAVFGTGSMNDGNNTLVVAASGSYDGSKLNLDMTTLGSINLYRLALAPSGDSASGDYQAFSANGQSWTGSANGTRSAE